MTWRKGHVDTRAPGRVVFCLSCVGRAFLNTLSMSDNSPPNPPEPSLNNEQPGAGGPSHARLDAAAAAFAPAAAAAAAQQQHQQAPPTCCVVGSVLVLDMLHVTVAIGVVR